MTSIDKALNLLRSCPRVSINNISDLPRSVPPGADIFSTPLNIEVQYASETAIAAIERTGGSIVTRFYDLYSIWAKQNPKAFFQRGLPIPKCKTPPADTIPYYASAENRGYLAQPEAIRVARTWLAQKYGYELPDFDQLPHADQQLMRMQKHPRQIFYGLQPGSLVSLSDKLVFKPLDEELQEFYAT